MAAVYKALDLSSDAIVAIKVLSPYVAQEPKFKARFEQEIKVLLELRHPHIVPVLDYGEIGEYAFIVMPFMDAGTLSSRLKGGPLPLRAAAEILSQISMALDYAHSHGVIHRDIKPSNILIDESGKAMLSDFGFARVADASLSLTGSALIGTPSYMSPEQCRGESATQKSDQYSLGVLLYQMLTGSLPFESETPMGVVIMHATEPLPPPREIYPDISPRVEEVILQAMEKNPDNRYPTLGKLNEAFQRTLFEESDISKPIRRTTLDHTTEVLKGVPSKLKIYLRTIWARPWFRRVAYSLLTIGLAVGVWAVLRDLYQIGDGADSTPSASLMATIHALSTENAPLQGTVLMPGELETSVAGTLIALQATSTAEEELASATTDLMGSELDPRTPLGSLIPPLSRTPSLTRTPTPTPTLIPAPTFTKGPPPAPTAVPTIDPKLCKVDRPSHPHYCTPTPAP
jgi:serine/threonine-protein kinase